MDAMVFAESRADGDVTVSGRVAYRIGDFRWGSQPFKIEVPAETRAERRVRILIDSGSVDGALSRCEVIRVERDRGLL